MSYFGQGEAIITIFSFSQNNIEKGTNYCDKNIYIPDQVFTTRAPLIILEKKNLKCRRNFKNVEQFKKLTREKNLTHVTALHNTNHA